MATLFRAAVMLSVLVGLPGAWIYYGPLPTRAQRVVDRFVAVAKEAAGWKEVEAPARPTWDFTKSAPLDASGLADGDSASNVEAPRFGVASATAPTAAAPGPATLQIGSALPAPAPVAKEPDTLAERVEPWLTQLRQFGVAEYALERWGGRRQALPVPLRNAGRRQFVDATIRGSGRQSRIQRRAGRDRGLPLATSATSQRYVAACGSGCHWRVASALPA
jgi:hypothetical protein